MIVHILEVSEQGKDASSDVQHVNQDNYNYMTTLFCTIHSTSYTVHNCIVLFVCIVLSVYIVYNYFKYERAVRHQNFPSGLIKYLSIYVSIYSTHGRDRPLIVVNTE